MRGNMSEGRVSPHCYFPSEKQPSRPLPGGEAGEKVASFLMFHELAFCSVLFDLTVIKYSGKINFKVKYWVEDYVLFGMIKIAALFCSNRKGRSKTVYSVQRAKMPREVTFSHSNF